MRGRQQLVQDAAGTARMRGIALRAQQAELALELLEADHAFMHACDLLVDQTVDVGAIVSRPLGEVEQPLHIGQRHAEIAAMADECKPLTMRVAVLPVAIALPWRLGQQTGFLVVTYGLDRHAGGAGQFPDPHGRFFKIVMKVLTL